MVVLRAHTLTKWKLGSASALIVVPQVVVMHVAGVQKLFTGADVAVSLSARDWLAMFAVASSVVWGGRSSEVDRAASGCTRGEDKQMRYPIDGGTL